MKIYLLPGLGFNHQIFRNLKLKNFELHYIDWIEPHKNEAIQDYARRLSVKIDDKASPIMLIGHSLGGILSQEIAKIKPIHSIILLSSIRSRAENPFYFKIIQPLGIHHLFTKKLITKTVKYWGPTHGYETEEEQTLFKNMIKEQSNHYLRWALKTLSIWRPITSLPSTKIIQIHGDKDKTFPIRKIKQTDYLVKGGGHFMVFKKAKMISDMIIDILKKEV